MPPLLQVPSSQSCTHASPGQQQRLPLTRWLGSKPCWGTWHTVVPDGRLTTVCSAAGPSSSTRSIEDNTVLSVLRPGPDLPPGSVTTAALVKTVASGSSSSTVVQASGSSNNSVVEVVDVEKCVNQSDTSSGSTTSAEDSGSAAANGSSGTTMPTHTTCTVSTETDDATADSRPSAVSTSSNYDINLPTSLASSSQVTSPVKERGSKASQRASGSVDLLSTVDEEGGTFSTRDRKKGSSSSTSVDSEDTPEDLADVEATSVAPVADWFRNQEDITTLSYAVLTGAVVAASVFAFDVSIQYIHDLPDIFSKELGIGGGRATGFPIFGTFVPFRCIMPVAAGFFVAALQSQGFSPALKFLTRAIEGVVEDKRQASLPTSYAPVFRKAAASAITLGSGASLGPEAPSVELGANTAAVLAPKTLSRRRQRMLIAAGAAAGVSAAFDAPIAGALFAVEFVLKSSRLGLDRLSTSTVFVSTSVAAGVIGFLRVQGQALGISGAATHLVGRIPYFSIQPNLLVDVLQFSALGAGCAVAAVSLYEGVRVCEVALRPLPRWLSAPTAGALCGVIALKFPQVQYGYVNLEEIFRGTTAKTQAWDLAALLLAKIAATSVCVGGGLVGGLFAPSLFLGALTGDVLGKFVADAWGLPDPTSLIVVGAAAVLGAACRAPLTAMALMVEITRDTGLLVPLLSAIGVASLFTDYLEGIFSQRLEAMLVQLYLREKQLFWGASTPSTNNLSLESVQKVIGTRALLYVRHTLPLEQAREAMVAKGSPAAVVVDDNFSPMGVVYLEDVEAELIKRQLLLENDNNFSRA